MATSTWFKINTQMLQLTNQHLSQYESTEVNIEGEENQMGHYWNHFIFIGKIWLIWQFCLFKLKVFVLAEKLRTKRKFEKKEFFFIQNTFFNCNLNHLGDISEYVKSDFIIHSVISKMFNNYINNWHCTLQLEISSGRGGNILQIYSLFKERFETEMYCKIPLPYAHK